MSWIEHHENSERLASQAQVAAQEGRRDEAQALYARAAGAEESAIADLDRPKLRTLGISAVSAASLHYKANRFECAEAVAARWLVFEALPAFAKDQLRLLLHACRNRGPGGEFFGSGPPFGLPAHLPEADPESGARRKDLQQAGHLFPGRFPSSQSRLGRAPESWTHHQEGRAGEGNASGATGVVARNTTRASSRSGLD